MPGRGIISSKATSTVGIGGGRGLRHVPVGQQGVGSTESIIRVDLEYLQLSKHYLLPLGL